MAVEKNIKINVDAGDGIKQVDKLKQGVKDTSKAASGSQSAFGKMKSGVSKLGIAFKALGIGLIVAAFVKLKDIFSGNIETARQFERVSARLSAAFDVIRDRAEDFIKSLIALKNPFKAFKDAFTGTTAEIKEETKAVDELTIALQKVRDEEREMVIERAKANKIIAESRLLAEDETRTIEERLVALKRAVAEEQRVAQMELDTQQKKVDALQQIIDLGKSSEEDMQNLANERARLIDLQTSSTQRQLRVTREVNTMERELLAERKKDSEKIIELKAKEVKADDDASDQFMKNQQKLAKARLEDSKNQVKLEELTQEQKEAIMQNAVSGVVALLGEESKASKAIQVGMAIRDTYVGATKALAQGGIFGALQAGGIIAMGLANVRKIMSTGDEGGSAGGGVSASDSGADASASDQAAVVGDMLPNMEAVAGPTLGEPGPVQAYVVENDISNAQALQEELDIQATL